MGGRDDADVHLLGPVTPYGAHLALLEHTQQLGLRAEVQLRDLVEEERTAVRFTEEPTARHARAGEGAFVVSEELGIRQIQREGRTVEAHEGRMRTRTGTHDGLGQALLSGAALPRDQHRDVLARDSLHHQREPLHGRRRKHHRPRERELCGELRVVDAQAYRIRRALHHREQLFGLEGLPKIVEGPHLHRLDRGPLGSMRGDQDDFGREGAFSQSTQELEAIHLWHPQVGEDQMMMSLIGVIVGGERARSVRCIRHLEARVLQDAPERVSNTFVVIHDQDARGHADVSLGPERGSVSRASQPPFTRLWRVRSPPC